MLDSTKKQSLKLAYAFIVHVNLQVLPIHLDLLIWNDILHVTLIDLLCFLDIEQILDHSFIDWILKIFSISNVEIAE